LTVSGKEVLVRIRVLAADGRHEHDGVAHGDDDGAVGLAGEAPVSMVTE